MSIDANHDGEISADEQMVRYFGNNSCSQYFMLPSDVRSGGTRMRVVVAYGGASTPCGTFCYGEVENSAVIIP